MGDRRQSAYGRPMVYSANRRDFQGILTETVEVKCTFIAPIVTFEELRDGIGHYTEVLIEDEQGCLTTHGIDGLRFTDHDEEEDF